MHENREISCTSWPTDQDRSVKAMNRTADANVQEKSDCAVVPMNQPNNEGQQPSAEAGEGRAQTEENIVPSHASDTEREAHVPGIARCAASSAFRRHSSTVRAVCVNAPVRICAGGDQRWSSLPRQLFQRHSASPQKPEVISPCNLPTVRAPQSDSGAQHSSRNKGALGHFPVPTQQTPRYPAASKPLIIILDIRYQYAIMVLLRRHDSSVPCEPCSPATRSF